MNREKIKESVLLKYRNKVESRYRQRTPRSSIRIEQFATKYMPGGDYREAIWFEPYPTVMMSGDGCYLNDIDGNKYIDFSNCWTALVLGNNPPNVVGAITKQAKQSIALSAPTDSVYEWAKLICDRVPSIERIRFCCSGSEANMFAIRAARAYTGKDKVLKMEGGYHGTYDPLETSVGWQKLPIGLPKSIESDVLVTRFNDKDKAEAIITKNRDKLAAVIVEGIIGAGGMIPPEYNYLQFLREVTEKNDILLILDEVISFRLAYGGAQEIYNIKPDLTVLGKVIGGGLPVGAFGGREDIMAVFSPKREPHAHHTGTFVATPLVVAAGIATLNELTTEAIERINQLGDLLANGMKRALADLKINAQVTGYGSLHQVHFTSELVTHAAVSTSQNKELLHLFHLSMLNKGICIPARCMFSVSTPMVESEITQTVNAVHSIISELNHWGS
ncbi:aspartate aminotransferase family protein [Chloroflexota bacterium]